MNVNVTNIVQDILQALFEPLTQGTSAIADTIKTVFTDLMFDVTTVEGVASYALNPFGATIIVFGGISLLLSLTYLVYNLVRSKIG